MIDRLKPLAIFASVLRNGSFRGAARELGLSPSVVSTHVSTLERDIGRPLLYRSTRSVTATREGERLFEASTAMLDAAYDALSVFSRSSPSPLAKMRIAVPATLNHHPIVRALTRWASDRPGLVLQILSSDTQLDLQGNRIDLAVRMGRFPNSDLKTRRVGEDERVLVAAPSYIDAFGMPAEPQDLGSHHFVGFTLVPDEVRLAKPGMRQTVIWGRNSIEADSADAVRSLALSGSGIAALPASLVKADIESGALMRLLKDWSEQTLPICLVWSRNATLNSATRELIDWLAKKGPW